MKKEKANKKIITLVVFEKYQQAIIAPLLLCLYLFLNFTVACNKDKHIHEGDGHYTCSMHPQVVQHEPGTCPICGMKLSFVEATPTNEKQDAKEGDQEHNHEGHNSEGQSKNFRFSLSKSMLTNSSLATVTAQSEVFLRKRKYSAHVDYNEGVNRLVIISTKYDSWVEKLYVSKEGQFFQKGKALMSIYSPDILAAKEEYLITLSAVKSMHAARTLNTSTSKIQNQNKENKIDKKIYEDPTLQAVRRKLRYMDISHAQIKQLEKHGKSGRHAYYPAPISGVIIKKNVLQGAFIKAGQEVLRIANLNKLWVFIHIFEKDLGFIKKGQKVQLKTNAYPNKKFSGRIDLIYPFLEPQTKDIKVRIVISNQNGLLKPGMFAQVEIESKLPGKSITIPDTSVIYSGEKSYVFVSLGNRTFELRPVEIKITSAGKALISKGLAEGDIVATNSQFFLDSEASLKEVISKIKKSK